MKNLTRNWVEKKYLKRAIEITKNVDILHTVESTVWTVNTND